ncbi:hypothetical protein E4U02_15365 [Microbacterium paludicola]|uniref:Uncharacterized protein n=1 Tax=Microbacterium paludicola TaxID=300019 RepID=A0A4Y9FNG8_9MICO|nr:hypothetical protein [Microbacterium paludicola]MBF0817782.1 hypothetical protein [Microbacterium paludicola]TFU29869.1 hypothetical protein E4U02_15365 [Microbacterium paludicola]
MIDHPMAPALFSDNSVHPSWLGNELLTRLLETPTRPMALFTGLLADVTRPLFEFETRTVIVGRSVWLNRARRLRDAGCIAFRSVEFMTTEEAIAANDGESADYVVVAGLSERTPDFGSTLQRLTGATTRLAARANARKVTILFWEAAALQAKGSESALTPQALSALVPQDAVALSLARRDIDFGTLDPTLSGFESSVRALGGVIRRERFPGGLMVDAGE